MQKGSIDKITKKYIEEFLDDNRRIDYDEIPEKYGVRTYYYDELPTTDAEGYPIASELVLDGKTYTMEELDNIPEQDRARCRLRYYYMPMFHELYVGTTGSGKTTGCVEPQLRAISTQRNKPNLFITDPKGELFDRNAAHLKEQGYRLYILNFKDIARSDRWNPLDELYMMKQRTLHIFEEIEEINASEIEDDMNLIYPRREYVGRCYKFMDRIYPTKALAQKAAESQRDNLEIDIDSLIVQLANMFIIPKSKKDPMWEYGAQDALSGILYAMLEDSITDPNFTRDMMTLRTVHDYYWSLRSKILTGDERPNGKLFEHPLVKNKSNKVLGRLSCMFDNAPGTMRSYCGVFDNSMKDWFNGHIMTLTSGNTVDLLPDGKDDVPFAIFLVTRDYEKSDFQVAGLFVDWVYRNMLEYFERHLTNRDTHFMLDEFGNIPEIKDFEIKIATARSRRLWFHLVVQSYLQLDNVYDPESSRGKRARIIIDNCNSHVFLGSQNFETKKEFFEECGKHFIPSPNSLYNPQDHSLDEVYLVPPCDLDTLSPGTAIIKRMNCPVIDTSYIRSYICGKFGIYNNFFKQNALLTLAPTEYTSINDPKFIYAPTQPNGVATKKFSGYRF